MQSVAITILDPAVGHPRTFGYECHDGERLAALIKGTQEGLTLFPGATITNIEVI